MAQTVRAVVRAIGLTTLLRIAAGGITFIAAVANLTNAHAAPIDACAKMDTLKNLIRFDIALPEPANETGPEDFCTITITNRKFAKTVKDILLEPATKSISDLVTFQNNILGQAAICFSSDTNTDSCVLAKPDITNTFEEPADSAAIVTTLFAGFKVIAISDCDPNTTNKCKATTSSDRIEIAATPEPATLAILAAALLGLAFMQEVQKNVRRRRNALSENG
jgi:hypothetical protein